jgi:Bacterial membrane protein YfhO.
MGFTGTEKNPFASQNELFQKATGIEAPLFEEVTGLVPIDTGHALTEAGGATYTFEATASANSEISPETLRWEMDAPTDGIYYLYVNAEASKNGRYGMGLIERAQDITLPYIRCIGAFEQGDPLFVEAFLDAEDSDATSIVVRMAVIDPEAFRAGYAVLAANQLDVLTMEGPVVEGFIAMREAGLLYTSIPYEKGWTVRVDQVDADIVPIGGAMAGVMLDAGNHAVRFEYRTPGLLAGLLVTLAAVIVYVIMLCRRKAKDIVP